MDTGLLREEALVSFYANAEACLLCVVGAAAVYFRLADQTFFKMLSRLLLRLFFSSLSFGNFRAYSASRIARWWPVWIVSLLNLLLGGRSATSAPGSSASARPVARCSSCPPRSATSAHCRTCSSRRW